jgi:hypothetical protein
MSDMAAPEPKAAAAEYIALEASRLARIAGERDLKLLHYLIDMVVLEAWREATEGDENRQDVEAGSTPD